MSGSPRPTKPSLPERHAPRGMGLASTLAALAARMQPAPSGVTGLLAGLWTEWLRHDAGDPAWPDRDRFVVSDGTLSGLLYAALHLTGYEGMELDVLRRFGQAGCAASPRPMPSAHPAIEAAAGSPAQGFAAAVGMALAERALAARFGRSLVDHRTWVLAGNTELVAGLGQEAASMAGALRLDRLTVAFEADGDAGEAELARRFAACGWAVRRIDGTDPDAVSACLAAAARGRKPTLIACHASAAPPVQDHPDARTAWRHAGARDAAARRAWLKRLQRHPLRHEFEECLAGRLPEGGAGVMQALGGPVAEGTFEAMLRALHVLEPLARKLIFLSSTRASPSFDHLPPVRPERYGGRHLDCGGQEHGMTTVAHGLALHGGLVPVCAAPAIAADRIRPALRLAALTGRRMVQLLTEDGTSCADGAAQPVEQLAGLRAMPGLFVFRPACAVEVSECLDLVLRRPDGPSVVMLSSTPSSSTRVPGGANASARGGYVAADVAGERDATLVASGTELKLALAARLLLAREGLTVAVVSLPCWELFGRQDAAYRARVLGQAPRFGIEAAHGFGWERWLGEGRFIGLDGSGARDGLQAHAGLTAERIASAVLEAR